MNKSANKILLLLICFFGQGILRESHAQNTADTLRVMTSAICTSCKKRIENDLSFEAGVRKVAMDLETKQVTVVYNPKKTSPEKIRQAITKIGYDADSLKADQKAYMRLPECCRDHDAAHPH